MIDIGQKKKQIITLLESSGPSIPVRIAKTIGMDPVFASAILSELLNSKDIKMSHMRVGSSPFYLLEGQEKMLEEEVENLKSAEKEAYLKLKKEKVLIDEKESPMIRVALRTIKDFAIPFKLNEKIFWRYTFATEDEIKEKLNPKKEEPLKEKEPQKEEVERQEKQAKEKEEDKKIEPIFSNEEKPEFLNEVKEFLKDKNIEFLEEIKTEKKEIVARINIKTTLGNINFLLIAKNKQTLTKEEINSAMQQAIYNNTPCLILIRKEPTTTIKKILEENHLIKLEVIKK